MMRIRHHPANQPMLPGFEPPAPEIGDYEGWLNVYSFIHRCFYHTAEEALADARRAIKDLGKLYVVQHDGGPPDIWTDELFWMISEQPPFCEQVVGAFYYHRPPQYIVTLGQEIFVAGESPEIIKAKEVQAWADFERREGCKVAKERIP
ncbi:MAG: hypothetical protein Q8O55_08960 [Dehalococcoidales bacterium]|nr:hypothetical protein [Dehalococcoidales bacterium]